MNSAIVERRNLICLVKLCVQDLLDTALQNDRRALDADCVHLQNFLNLIEAVFRHQIKVSGRRTMMSGFLPSVDASDRSLWSLLEMIPGAESAADSARHIPTIQSYWGKCRAWIRLALMQKHLADYVAKLVDMDLLPQLYNESALLRNDEFALLCGLLVGVNVVDFNFCLKDENLDSVDTTVNFEPYLRRDAYSLFEAKSEPKDSLPEELQSVLDQKNYTEELNRQLNANIEKLRKENENLKLKCTSIDTADDLAQQLQDVKNINLKLFEKLQAATSEKDNLQHNLSLVQKKRDDAVVRSNQLESKLLLTELEHRQAQDAQEDLGDCKQQVVILESDLKIEREWRKQLQGTNRQQGDRIEQLAEKVASLKLQVKQYEAYRSKCDDLDKTLEEMGAKLCDVQIQKEELKEKANNSISTWQDDKEAEACSACEKPFSVSRRRHHCRKCGQIFCSQCSEGSMPLIQGGKPVRVCDACQQELLQMYSVNSAAVQPRKASFKSTSK